MASDLEHRLAELAFRQPDGFKALALVVAREAARIGAEIEREECAALADSMFVPVDSHDVGAAIRARGGK